MKVSKNYRLQNIFRDWSCILTQVDFSQSVGRWVSGEWSVGQLVSGSVVLIKPMKLILQNFRSSVQIVLLDIHYRNLQNTFWRFTNYIQIFYVFLLILNYDRNKLKFL